MTFTLLRSFHALVGRFHGANALSTWRLALSSIYLGARRSWRARRARACLPRIAEVPWRRERRAYASGRLIDDACTAALTRDCGVDAEDGHRAVIVSKKTALRDVSKLTTALQLLLRASPSRRFFRLALCELLFLQGTRRLCGARAPTRRSPLRQCATRKKKQRATN